MFTYILMRGGQARPCQTRQRFTYPLQLPSVSSLTCLCIFQSSHSGVLDLKEQPSALRWNHRLYDIVIYVYECTRSTGSLRPSALPQVYQAFKITLITRDVKHGIGAIFIWNLCCSFLQMEIGLTQVNLSLSLFFQSNIFLLKFKHKRRA